MNQERFEVDGKHYGDITAMPDGSFVFWPIQGSTQSWTYQVCGKLHNRITQLNAEAMGLPYGGKIRSEIRGRTG